MERRLFDTARVASALLGAAVLVLLVPMLLALWEQRAVVPWPWAAGLVVGAAATCGLAVAIRERAAAWVLYAATAAGLGLFPLVADDRYPSTMTPIAYHLFPVGAAATCLLSRRVPVATALLLALQGALLWTETVGPWRPEAAVMVGNALFGLAVAAAGQAVLQASRATERSVAEAQESAIREYSLARSAEARSRAAARWDAYVHDEILSVLSEIADASPRASRAAREALDRAAVLEVEEIPAPPLAEGLLEATLSLLPEADTLMRTTEDAVPIPGSVQQALVEAASEALRNIDRHAYPSSRRGSRADSTLFLRHDRERVAVVVRDHGVGFDKRHVAPSRLGILVSIQGRVEAVGGTAEVTSAPGQGTRVRLCWSPPR